jgi:hypothetical protein
MSIFARALSGAAQGVAQVTNKWIDEELTQQRAQFMAELQRSNASAMRGDQAAFEDQRAPVRLAQEQARALAMGQTAAEVETANLSNPELNAARRTRADEDTSAATQREIDAAVKKASDPNLTRLEREAAQRKLEDLQKEQRIKGNEAIRVSNATRQREGGPDVMAKVAQIEKVLGRPLNEQERLAMVGLASKPKDTPLGEETVETTSKDGLTVTKRKMPIMAGAQPQGQQAPYPDGTKLRGPDGKMYVVKGGVPTLADTAAPDVPRRQPAPELPPPPSMLDPVQHMNYMRKYGSNPQQR